MNKITTYFYTLQHNPKVNGKILDYQEFYLIFKSKIFKIIIGKKEDGLIIKSKSYIISFNSNDISSSINYKFVSIDETYEFIINLFKENKVVIKNVLINKELQLISKINVINKHEEIIFNLKYEPKNKDFNYVELNNKYNQIENELNELKKENNKLKNELNLLKSYYNKNHPKDMHNISDLTKESYSDDISDNTFTVFKSTKDLFYLIFSNKNKSIIGYDINEKKRVIEIKNAHNEHITNFRHYLDNIYKRDLVLSISYSDKNIKIWNIATWECLLSIANIYNNGYLYSAYFLNSNNNIFILTSNYNLYGDSGPIKVFDFTGKKIKEIEGSNENTSFLDIYYDKKLLKNFVITGNSNYVKSYDYDNNEIFKKYSDNYNNNHLSIIINNNNIDEVILIESCYDGNIRVWNFYSGLLLNKIKIGDNWLYGICLWNDQFLFVGCSDKTIKLIDIKESYIVKNFKGHNNPVLTIKKISHPQYGECLISQGYNEDPIKLWINKNYG